MASPRTRRVLQELRPTNENTVSEINICLFYCVLYEVNIIHLFIFIFRSFFVLFFFVCNYRNALNVGHIIHNGFP